MRKTEAWWKCGVCGKLVTRSKKGFLKKIRKHEKEEGHAAKCCLVQVEQRKRKGA